MKVNELDEEDGTLKPLREVNFAAYIGPESNDPLDCARYQRRKPEQRGRTFYLEENLCLNDDDFRKKDLYPYISTGRQKDKDSMRNRFRNSQHANSYTECHPLFTQITTEWNSSEP